MSGRFETSTPSPTRGELLVQAEGIEYVNGPVTFMQLRVMAGAPAAPDLPNPVPGDLWVDADGESIGGLILWHKRGYLDALEYFWTTDDMPTELPTPSQVRGSSQ